STTSKMTRVAASRTPVDWQVQAHPGADPAQVLATVRHRPDVSRAVPVSFGTTTGFTATAGASTQQTGPGKVLGLPPAYASAFPGELRTLVGSASGVLLAQQTAANLHARPGDIVKIGRPHGRPAAVKVDGVVDLPAADSLFQQVGAPPGAQAQAPPDNVILLPAPLFSKLEGAGVTQVHAGLDHRLPASPSSAFKTVDGRKLNLETKLAGA